MIRLGDFEITHIPEITLPGAPTLFPEWTEAEADAIAAKLPGWRDEGGGFEMSIHAWLVRGPDMLALIDLGCGNGKRREGAPQFGDLDTPFLDRLAAAGARPEDITHVFLTHLHVDHVGWATAEEAGEQRLVFPQALHVMTTAEREARDPARGGAALSPRRTAHFVDSVRPVLDQGRVQLVEGDEADFLPGLDLLPLPGHAVGQMGLRLRSQGKTAIFSADAMHSAAQVIQPEWSSVFCEDPDLARRTRRALLERAVEEEALLLPGHFGGSHCGHVRREGEGYAWIPSTDIP